MAEQRRRRGGVGGAASASSSLEEAPESPRERVGAEGGPGFKVLSVMGVSMMAATFLPGLLGLGASSIGAQRQDQNQSRDHSSGWQVQKSPQLGRFLEGVQSESSTRPPPSQRAHTKPPMPQHKKATKEADRGHPKVQWSKESSEEFDTQDSSRPMPQKRNAAKEAEKGHPKHQWKKEESEEFRKDEFSFPTAQQKKPAKEAERGHPRHQWKKEGSEEFRKEDSSRAMPQQKKPTKEAENGHPRHQWKREESEKSNQDPNGERKSKEQQEQRMRKDRLAERAAAASGRLPAMPGAASFQDRVGEVHHEEDPNGERNSKEQQEQRMRKDRLAEWAAAANGRKPAMPGAASFQDRVGEVHQEEDMNGWRKSKEEQEQRMRKDKLAERAAAAAGRRPAMAGAASFEDRVGKARHEEDSHGDRKSREEQEQRMRRDRLAERAAGASGRRPSEPGGSHPEGRVGDVHQEEEQEDASAADGGAPASSTHKDPDTGQLEDEAEEEATPSPEEIAEEKATLEKDEASADNVVASSETDDDDQEADGTDESQPDEREQDDPDGEQQELGVVDDEVGQSHGDSAKEEIAFEEEESPAELPEGRAKAKKDERTPKTGVASPEKPVGKELIPGKSPKVSDSAVVKPKAETDTAVASKDGVEMDKHKSNDAVVEPEKGTDRQTLGRGREPSEQGAATQRGAQRSETPSTKQASGARGLAGKTSVEASAPGAGLGWSKKELAKPSETPAVPLRSLEATTSASAAVGAVHATTAATQDIATPRASPAASEAAGSTLPATADASVPAGADLSAVPGGGPTTSWAPSLAKSPDGSSTVSPASTAQTHAAEVQATEAPQAVVGSTLDTSSSASAHAQTTPGAEPADAALDPTAPPAAEDSKSSAALVATDPATAAQDTAMYTDAPAVEASRTSMSGAAADTATSPAPPSSTASAEPATTGAAEVNATAAAGASDDAKPTSVPGVEAAEVVQ